MASFEDLEVWQRSCDLAVEVCDAFKSCKDYGLRDQITRSAVSVPSNIAEGAERLSRKEFAQFLGYAKGSAGELRTQIIIASRLGYIEDARA
jgi:four helix bundle protein